VHAPAILKRRVHATGVRINEIPAKPEKVLDALARRAEGRPSVDVELSVAIRRRLDAADALVDRRTPSCTRTLPAGRRTTRPVTRKRHWPNRPQSARKGRAALSGRAAPGSRAVRVSLAPPCRRT